GPALLRRLLVDLLEHDLGCAVHQVLGLLEAEAGQAAHLLDDLNLLVARSLEDDVELVLLLGLLGLAAAGAGRGRRRHRHGGGRLHVERLLELLHELGELEQGHLLERLEEVVSAHLRHGGVSSFLQFLACSPVSLRRLRPTCPAWRLYWPRLNWRHLNWPRLNWRHLNWPRLNWPHLNWPYLYWRHLNWPRLCRRWQGPRLRRRRA